MKAYGAGRKAVIHGLRRLWNDRKSQRGFGLVETLMAIALAGTAVTAFVLALSTGSIAVNEHDGQTVAQQLAQSQLEYVKSYTYDAGAVTYPAIAAPTGYAISVGVGTVPNTDNTIQAITVTVTRDGDTVLAVENYKVDR